MTDWKRARRILLCVTGGIAAYKTPELVSRLRKLDCEVEIFMTRAAERLVSPLALSTLSGRRVWRQDDFLSPERGHEIPHVRVSDWAEVAVVAPCTANTASDLAHGRGESLVSAALLAAACPVLLFPAMNERMFEHPATRRNLSVLSERGIRVVAPEFGVLACGCEGKGRLPETGLILEEIFRALAPEKTMEGVRLLVTAGPTREYLDPVRYLSNPSTGRMGLAMARTAWYRGAEVRVILGPVGETGTLHGLEVRRVVSALEMYEAVLAELDWASCVVKAAAVGDYRAKAPSARKVKREGRETVSLELEQNPDIAAEVGRRKRPDQILIGFAAETDDLLKNARAKMERKGLDLIVANDVSAPGCGFGADTNTVRVLSRDGEAILSGSKEEVADEIWRRVARRGLF